MSDTKFGQQQTQSSMLVASFVCCRTQFGGLNSPLNFTKHLCNDHLNIEYSFIYIIDTYFTVKPVKYVMIFVFFKVKVLFLSITWSTKLRKLYEYSWPSYYTRDRFLEPLCNRKNRVKMLPPFQAPQAPPQLKFWIVRYLHTRATQEPKV